jgi:hypothetical protein
VPESQLPVIFFHGISPGLCVYLPFLMTLTRGRAAVLVEVSQRTGGRAPIRCGCTHEDRLRHR